MKKINLAVVFLMLIIVVFTTGVKADFKTGVSKDREEIKLNFEYVFDKYAIKLSPTIRDNFINQPKIELGGKYYLNNGKGFFSELSVTAEHLDVRTELDFHAGAGYSLQLPFLNSLFLNGKAGYSYTAQHESDYYMSAGLNFSISELFQSRFKQEANRTDKRLSKLRKEYDNWNEEMIQYVAQEKIVRGMTKKQVQESWGQPERKYRKSEDHTSWVYEKWDEEDGKYRKLILNFAGEKLNHWSVTENNL